MEIRLTSTEMKVLLHPKNSLKLLTGISALFFDKYGSHGNGHDQNREELGHPEVVAPKSDDFTLINGIGPTFARRLHEAGIHTFADLAALTPATIKEVVKIADWQGDPAGWIAQARARI